MSISHAYSVEWALFILQLLKYLYFSFLTGEIYGPGP